MYMPCIIYISRLYWSTNFRIQYKKLIYNVYIHSHI